MLNEGSDTIYGKSPRKSLYYS